MLGTVPDNAFQRARLGENYDLKARALAVLLGGLKLFGVGFVSSIGTLSVSNGVWAIRKSLNRDFPQKSVTKRSPMFKTAFVYGSFLGLSANLRYQVRRHPYYFRLVKIKIVTIGIHSRVSCSNCRVCRFQVCTNWCSQELRCQRFHNVLNKVI